MIDQATGMHCTSPIQLFMLQVTVGEIDQEAADQRNLDTDPAHKLVVVDGQVSAQLSNMAGLPDGVFIGSLQDAPNQATADQLVSQGNHLHFAAVGALPHCCINHLVALW